ncbi:hypothetical protein [Paraburkholderia sp.]|uniref:hypothetical protein n=1 Tax=Paraburkholderia sp. TaxID=1926495 RepID=UPI0025F43431|nr:hypothetical protein [Paraburkholderia sp.]
MSSTFRASVTVPCPGSKDNLVILVDTPWQVKWGLGNPANSGSCTLFVVGLDDSGNPMDDGINFLPLTLYPGGSVNWYWPPSGAAKIAAVCSSQCNGSGTAILEYDAPTA